MPPAVAFSRILTLDASMAVCSAGLMVDGAMFAWQRAEADLATLPTLAAAVLGDGPIDLVAVTIGPGSFTGLRAAIALAHGIALAAQVPVRGVTVGAALAWGKGTPYWTAIDSKRGRIFLERGGEVETLELDALPLPDGPIWLGGDAALTTGEALAARGATVYFDPCTTPEPPGIAAAALAGSARAALPLYVEPPAARPAAAGRPAPQ